MSLFYSKELMYLSSNLSSFLIAKKYLKLGSCILNHSQYIGETYSQTCRPPGAGEYILIPGGKEACRYISNGNGECFCAESNCNTKQLLDMFIENYEDGILDCVGGRCEDSNAVCYISGSGELVKIKKVFDMLS